MAKNKILEKKIEQNSILTLFQKEVYKAILDIPRGEIRSYRWVAEKIGNLRASRAVGNALNSNPYSPEVPCHRVIRSDGSIGGYAGGISKKKAILRNEGISLEEMKKKNI